MFALASSKLKCRWNDGNVKEYRNFCFLLETFLFFNLHDKFELLSNAKIVATLLQYRDMRTGRESVNI